MADSLRLLALPGTCDTHMHVFEPGYPLLPGTNLPSIPGDAAHYRLLRERLGITRTVVVQPTAYGNDHRCTLEAMQVLADEQHQTRGVALLLPEDSDAEMARLAGLGICGIRYYLVPGGMSWDTVEAMAARIAVHGWHLQLQMDGRELAERASMLAALPCEIVIDHIGRFTLPMSFDEAGWKALLRLVEGGRCWVKLSAPYHGSRTGPPDYADAGALATALIRAAPDRMLYASNWPHPSLKSNHPDDGALLDLLCEWAGSDSVRKQILVDNPARLYRF